MTAEIINFEAGKRRLGQGTEGHEPGPAEFAHASGRVRVTCTCGWSSYWVPEAEVTRIYLEHLRLTRRRRST